MKEGDLVADRYRLLRPIGAGGMATVWAARHELLGRDFALKFAVAPVRIGKEARARFLREAQIVAKLRHPNIVDVADVGEVTPGGDLYIAMELLEGASLAARISERGRLRPHEAAAIASEVASGLAAAHQAGVVHRDVKPENVFLARGSSGGIVPKLLDFGVSKARHEDIYATYSGQLLGTPAYMSPEQALGETDIDHRTDIWSLGVVVYEMLTGRHPFDAPNYQALLPKIAEGDHDPLGAEVPPALHRVVDRCLAKGRGDRYPTADALGDALEVALVGLSRGEDDGSLRVERQEALPSLAPAPMRPIAPRAVHGTLSPSIHPVDTPVAGRRLVGLAVVALLVTIVGGVIGLRFLSHGKGGAPAAADGDHGAATAVPAATATPAAAVEPTSEIEIIDRSAPSAEPTPDSPIAAPEAARAPAKRKPAGTPRRQNGQSVTRVNSAGF